MKKIKGFFVIFLFLLTFSIQSWGYNKVQYKDLNWYYIETEHFRIFFYNNSYVLAQKAAFFLERAYSNLVTRFRYYPSQKFSVIIYATPFEFQQTNIVLQYIGEGVGGFTESVKYRIVVPFSGDYYDFRHVLHHELTHAFIYDMVSSKYGKYNLFSILWMFPLWFHEGLCEYTSLGWDNETDIYIRELVISGILDKIDLSSSSGFMMYKLGQSFIYYLSEKYSESTLFLFIKEFFFGSNNKSSLDWYSNRFYDTFKKVFGEKFEDAVDDWKIYLKEKYWSKFNYKSYNLNFYGKPITKHIKDLTLYNVNPSINHNDSLIAYFTDRDDYDAIFIYDVKQKKVIKKIKQDVIKNYESFHPFYSKISWNPYKDTIYYSATINGKDEIIVYSVKKNKIVKKLRFKNIEVLKNPKPSPMDDYTIAFESIDEKNRPFIGIYDYSKNSLIKIGVDYSKEYSPSFSPDGRYIVFVKEYFDNMDNVWNYKTHYLLIRYDLSNGESEVIYSSKYKIDNPVFYNNDSTILFINYSSGIGNIKVLDLNTKRSYYITNSYRNIRNFSIGKNKIVLNYLNEFTFDVYIEDIDSLFKYRFNSLPKAEGISDFIDKKVEYKITKIKSNKNISKKIEKLIKDFEKEKRKLHIENKKDTLHVLVAPSSDTLYEKSEYKPEYSIDFIYMALYYQILTGVTLLGNIIVSDELGNNRIYLSFNSNMEIKDIDRDLNFSFFYQYLSKRPDYYLGIGRYPIYFMVPDSFIYTYYYDIKNWAFLGIKYPLSVYNSLYFIFNPYLIVRHKIDISFEDYYGIYTMVTETEDLAAYKKKPFISLSTGYNTDNRIYDVYGPVNGTYIDINLKSISDAYLKNSIGEMNIDLRKYFRFKRSYTLATRFLSGYTKPIRGENFKYYYLGGEYFTINPSRIPKYENLDYSLDAFSNFDVVVPFRGYDIFELKTHNFFMTNMEFRFPFISNIDFYFPFRFRLSYIQGDIFLDIAACYNNYDELKSVDNYHIGTGLGYRINLYPYFILKFDWAKPIYLKNIGKDSFDGDWKFYLSLSGEF